MRRAGCNLLAVAGALLALAACDVARCQIPEPADAPRPLAPDESARRFTLADGFRLELVAAEPLVREPSGVCWDERGQLFVCELHGYNLEGQYDIEELNKTGQLDRVVRRIPANEEAVRKAEAETHGAIKRLIDADGDGRADRAEMWADRLPPCLGICPALGGLVAVCQTQILFLADRDGDGAAETRAVLFEGFAKGPLERNISNPKWGPDNWIHVARGSGGGEIRGPRLTAPVRLGGTDFRLRPDGTALEPVVGGTHTIGHAFTESGDRFVISTRTPGIFVAPLPWKYLARNPDLAAPSLQESATSEQRVYPTSQPHPWRARRAEDPGFSKFYTDRYGVAESAPNGYFTSACSPLVYQDACLPGLRGQLLACEPAQNLVHRALVERQGARLALKRAPGEQQSEFLASSDPWFHAIALEHAPSGEVFVVDFYREIIEDYSAIPRYLQQQYGLQNGHDRGRIWRLTHADAKPLAPLDMSRLSPAELAAQVASPGHWRRQTARRLLIERQARQAAPALARILREAAEPAVTLGALHALDGLGALTPADVEAALAHADPATRREGLRLCERFLADAPALRKRALGLAADPEPLVRLQAALSLGENPDPEALAALALLARRHGDEPWMRHAVLTAVPGRGGQLLAELLRTPSEPAQAASMLEPLCAMIGSRRDAAEMSAALVLLDAPENAAWQDSCLRGLRSSFAKSTRVELTDEGRAALARLAASTRPATRDAARDLATRWRLESPAERQARLAAAARDVGDARLPPEVRLAAVAALDADDDPSSTAALLRAAGVATPRVQEAILAAVCDRRDRAAALLEAVERKRFPPALLTSPRRAALLQHADAALRARAEALFGAATGAVSPGASAELFAEYAAALRAPRDAARGEKVFREKCATCHQAHGVGHAVGPDLSAEFQRAEETILRDVLTPSDVISPGYGAYAAVTSSGQVLTGLLVAESPTSLTLRRPEGHEHVVLRKDLEELRALPVSLMPDDLPKTVPPRDLADALAWLRRAPTRVVLLDENRALADALREGEGTAAFVDFDKHVGAVSLRVTPPQRFSARIEGWKFPVRERPGPGEYRHLRFAWKAESEGVMLELAADGAWPAADQATRRYHAGKNTTGWRSVEIAGEPPRQWRVVTVDLWKDGGDFTLTGLAPTAMGGAALFDAVELLQSVETP